MPLTPAGLLLLPRPLFTVPPRGGTRREDTTGLVTPFLRGLVLSGVEMELFTSAELPAEGGGLGWPCLVPGLGHAAPFGLEVTLAPPRGANDGPTTAATTAWVDVGMPLTPAGLLLLPSPLFTFLPGGARREDTTGLVALFLGELVL